MTKTIQPVNALDPRLDESQDERYQRLYEYALSKGNSPKAARLFAEARLSYGSGHLFADEMSGDAP